MGQRSDTGARRRGRRGRGLNIHISDVANAEIRGKNIEGRDIEILENEFNLVILVLGSVLFAGEYMTKQDNREVPTSEEEYLSSSI
jgi:hypothetical protein